MASGPPCYKVVLCGEYGVGKSSLFRRFVDNSFREDTGPRSTVGLDHFSKAFTVNMDTIKVSILSDCG
jgi:Ras-related protein Rab-6A